MDDLSVVEAPAVSLAYRGESLSITPLTVGQLPRFARAVRPVFAALAGLIASPSLGDGAGGGGDLGIELPVEQLLQMIDQHGEQMIEAAAVAIRKPAEWVAAGTPVEFMELVRKIIEVNADFFGRAVTAQAGAGPTPSST